jgi:hypothetical protein
MFGRVSDRSRSWCDVSEFEKALAALRGVAPPARVRVRPADLYDPTAGREKLIDEMSEAELCDRLGEWLRRDDWEVFYEVPWENARPDVVGFRGTKTLAIEAKRVDIFGVIKQGLRIARWFDRAYVALPFGAADGVLMELARLAHRADARGHRRPALPGVLAVGSDVVELSAPSAFPVRRAQTAALREAAERFGAERGGVPSTDQTLRNAEMWVIRISDRRSISELAETYHLSPTAVRTSLKRISAWREHLASGCPGYPCIAPRPTDRDFFAGAHRHAPLISGLPDRPPRPVD